MNHTRNSYANGGVTHLSRDTDFEWYRKPGMHWLMLAFLLSCGEPDSAPLPFLASGSITDPSGDGGGADIITASIEVTESTMTLSVQLTPTSFHPDSIRVGVHFDSDENPATGYTTINPGHAGFGIDCTIDLGALNPGTLSVRVSRFEGQGFVQVATGTIRVVETGYTAEVPADACEDDGHAAFKVDAFRVVRIGSVIGTTTRQDWAPDPGQAAGFLR